VRYVRSRPHQSTTLLFGLLQRLTYCLILFVAAPLIVLTGLTMSTTVTAN
jgi:thiosulfate reductase cytochrome b subunit